MWLNLCIVPQVVEELFCSLSAVFWKIPLSSAMAAAQKKKLALQKEALVTHATSSSPATPNITTTTSISPTQTSASLTMTTSRPDRVAISTAASTTCAIRSDSALPKAHCLPASVPTFLVHRFYSLFFLQCVSSAFVNRTPLWKSWIIITTVQQP